MSNQFLILQDWMEEILHPIKKDIKSDHLNSDPVFYKNYFGNRPQNRLTTEELIAAYSQELLKGNEDLSLWVVNRWVFKNGDVYQHFAERLSEINPDFDAIKELDEAQSKRVLSGAIEAFGAIATYLFVTLNGVVFPKSVKKSLETQAIKEREEIAKNEEEIKAQVDIQKLMAAHAREIARLNDKILGVQKKYTNDTESLKKQIRVLQQKLNAK